MLWILLALLAGIAWALWYVLQLQLWIPIAASGGVCLLAVALIILRLIRARSGAGALERAIDEQGRQQAMNAAPERRAEIAALQKQIKDGIAALKASKLAGKTGGSAALYALPWYAIIGPPGAGKTTALRHSGLQFPYEDSVRGVGGTRNCDWWFTNQAILLDTAGRYATQQQDQSEWMAFLRMLLKYRGDKPLNGLIVAISIVDVIDADEQQLEVIGQTLRARIDEVMNELRMVLPVYVLFTKCDLIAGFVQVFGVLRKSERAQAWGATYPLAEDKSDPGALFVREFDQLVSAIHIRSVKRLAQERDWQAKEAIYGFPLEYGAIRQSCAQLLRVVFQPSAFQATPMLRGFYFSSGTQEGQPLDRVLMRMGQAMGIRHRQQAMQPAVQPKSYFLHDVFVKVLFPDAQVAARSEAEVRRQRLTRLGTAAVALALAVILAIPSVVSYSGNRALLAEAESQASAVSTLRWDDGVPIEDKLARLEPLLARLKQLDAHHDEGVPFELSFWMYSGEEIRRPLLRLFVKAMQDGMVGPCQLELEKRLHKTTGKPEAYLDERTSLMTYLMLSDVKHLDVEWATRQYTRLWAEQARSSTKLSLIDLLQRMGPLVEHYFQLIKPDETGKARVEPVSANQKLVQKARDKLGGVPVRQRYYAQFVSVLSQIKRVEAGDYLQANLKYPPLTLKQVFANRPDVLKVLTSKQHKGEKKSYYEVEGPYTELGHYAVLSQLADGAATLGREAWVVPLTDEEKGDRVAANLKLVAEDYEQRYIAAWKGFLADLQIQTPATIKDAVALYAVLRKPEWPYLRIFRVLEDHCLWKNGTDQLKGQGLEIAEKRIERSLTRRTALRADVDLQKIVGRKSVVPDAFRQLIHFGVPKPGQRANETDLTQYIELVTKLRDEIQKIEDDQPGAPLETAVPRGKAAYEAVRTLLGRYEGYPKEPLLPLLTDPINLGGKVKPAE